MSLLSFKKEQVAQKIVSGMPRDDIAAEYNVTGSAISKFKSRNKDLITEQAKKILTELPSMVEADIHEMKTSQIRLKEATEGQELSETERFYISIAEKKKENYMRSIGILNSHTPAIVFQSMNIYNDHRTELSPLILKVLNGKVDDLTSLEEIEDASLSS